MNTDFFCLGEGLGLDSSFKLSNKATIAPAPNKDGDKGKRVRRESAAPGGLLSGINELSEVVLMVCLSNLSHF